MEGHVADFAIREATSEDHDAIINIRHDISDGRDYVPAMLEDMLKTHQCFVATVKDNIVAFMCAHLVDGGKTMITRAIRVCEKYEGQGITRDLKKYVERIFKEHGVERKAMTFDSDHILQKVLERKIPIVFRKKLSHFECHLQDLEKHSTRLNEISSSSETAEGIPMLKELIQSQEKTFLFPEEQIEYNFIPFRPTVSNVDKVLDRFSLVVYSRDKRNSAVMTLGSCYKCLSGVEVIISIYGNECTETMSIHLAKHLRECLKIDGVNVASDSQLFHLVVISSYSKTDERLANISKCLRSFGVLKQETIDSICCIEEDI